MVGAHEIICIECPLGCRVELTVDDAGEVVKIAGHQCKIGERYAVQELKSPMRIITATVKTEGSVRRLLPVRTNKPMPKNKLKECMLYLSTVKAKPVLAIGEVVVPNILGTGADLVCSDELLE